MDRAKMMSDIELIEELGRGVIGENYCAIELRAYVAQMFPERNIVRGRVHGKDHGRSMRGITVTLTREEQLALRILLKEILMENSPMTAPDSYEHWETAKEKLMDNWQVSL